MAQFAATLEFSGIEIYAKDFDATSLTDARRKAGRWANGIIDWRNNQTHTHPQLKLSADATWSTWTGDETYSEKEFGYGQAWLYLKERVNIQ